MCLLCTQLWAEDHWSEAAAADRRDDPDGVVTLERHADRRGRRLRDRARRARLVGLVLAGHGLTLTDWEGSSYLLADRKGSQVVVHDLAAVWEAADRLTADPPDPLDPALLERLRGSHRR